MRYTKKLLANPLILLIFWYLFLVFIFRLSNLLPLQENYLGGGKTLFLQHPFLLHWANFDGEHYLSISRHGYGPLQYFFFPVFPLIIKHITQFISGSILNYVAVGVLVSLTSLVAAILGLYKLLNLDYERKTVIGVICLLLVFPTSFYFGAMYTESIFLFFVVWSFYLARTNNFFTASILASIAGATRIIGIVLFPVLFVEAILQYKLNKNKGVLIRNLILTCIAPLGFILYLYFMYLKTGDAFTFKNTANIFGDQRSTHIIVLPQVFYRYIFKIFPHLTNYWPILFTTILEFCSAAVFFLISIYALFKIRISYALYLALGFLIPTLAGSFSSMPRYVIVLFPGFIVIELLLQRFHSFVRYLVYIILMIILAVAYMLFSRGYWVS